MLLPNYNLMRRDQLIGHHGGVCFYSEESIKVDRLHGFEDPNLEVFWTYIRPPRLPRGIPCIVNATVYHPLNAADNIMLDYLCRSLVTVEGHYNGCGIIIAGGFNHLNVEHLCYEFNLKQLVNAPTRGANTLDLVIILLQEKFTYTLSAVWSL